MRRLIGLVSIVLVTVSALPAAAAIPEVVLDDPDVFENSAGASDGYLVWVARMPDRLQHANAYVMAEGEDRVRVNPVGTHSFYVAIDGTTVVYQEGTRTDDDDLRFFDAITHDRSDPPDGVNTGSIEQRVSLSEDHLLFTRTNINRVPWRDATAKVVLFDLGNETKTVLEELPMRSHYLVSDQVNGDWATYESCAWRPATGYDDCQVFRYQISSQQLVQLPNPGLQQYAGALSSDGTVYLTRTRARDHWVCGKRTQIVRMPVVGDGTVIATLPDGRDALTSSALDGSDGSTTLYFDRTRCATTATGIYRIVDADTAT